jgi:uncharacterized protein YndB with AHSA1/START domain
VTGIELVEVFEGEPGDVWPMISDPAAMREWLDDEVELTLEVGAPIRTCGDGVTRVGVVDAVEAERRLVFTWTPCAPDSGPTTTVELELQADDDGEHTVLRVRERIVRAEITLDARLGGEFLALARC